VARVVVGGLGPAGPDLLTAATVAAIERLPRRWLRTARHPAAAAVADAQTFDFLYETAATLDAVYAGIVDALVEDAGAHGEVLYLVPGSPVVAERSVELLLPGLDWGWTPWPAASASSTASGSRWRRPASGGRSWWASATPGPCCRK
jgi:tetrapyrrole methylase family protein/MazG family protein